MALRPKSGDNSEPEPELVLESKQTNTTTFFDLPDEIVGNIASYLLPRDVGRFGETCRAAAALRPIMWESVTINPGRRFPLETGTTPHDIVRAVTISFFRSLKSDAYYNKERSEYTAAFFQWLIRQSAYDIYLWIKEMAHNGGSLVSGIDIDFCLAKALAPSFMRLFSGDPPPALASFIYELPTYVTAKTIIGIVRVCFGDVCQIGSLQDNKTEKAVENVKKLIQILYEGGVLVPDMAETPEWSCILDIIFNTRSLEVFVMLHEIGMVTPKSLFPHTSSKTTYSVLSEFIRTKRMDFIKFAVETVGCTPWLLFDICILNPSMKPAWADTEFTKTVYDYLLSFSLNITKNGHTQDASNSLSFVVTKHDKIKAAMQTFSCYSVKSAVYLLKRFNLTFDDFSNHLQDVFRFFWSVCSTIFLKDITDLEEAMGITCEQLAEVHLEYLKSLSWYNLCQQLNVHFHWEYIPPKIIIGLMKWVLEDTVVDASKINFVMGFYKNVCYPIVNKREEMDDLYDKLSRKRHSLL